MSIDKTTNTPHPDTEQGLKENTHELRKHPRRELSIEVLFTVPGDEPMTLTTGNASDGGIFLYSGGRQMPEIGTEVYITLSEFIASDIPLVMRACIVHKSDAGVGIEFLGPLTKR